MLCFLKEIMQFNSQYQIYTLKVENEYLCNYHLEDYRGKSGQWRWWWHVSLVLQVWDSVEDENGLRAAIADCGESNQRASVDRGTTLLNILLLGAKQNNA
ncbi:hypothetical protein SLE2022_192350 [Rubroshorea leprosula]